MKIIVCSIHLQDMVELSLQTIHDIVTENLGTLCISKSYRPLQIALNADRYESTRQKADLAALVLQDVGVNRHGGKFIVYICWHHIVFFLCLFLFLALDGHILFENVCLFGLSGLLQTLIKMNIHSCCSSTYYM